MSPIVDPSVNVRYSLPGFMPPTQPKADDRNIFEWNEAIDILIYREDSSLDAKTRTWALLFQGARGEHIEFTGATGVYTQLVTNDDPDPGEPGEWREYRFQAYAKTWPEGTHVLQVSLDEMHFEHFITINDALENRITPTESIDAYQSGEAGLPPVTPPASTYRFTANGLELYNPDTESWVTLTPRGSENQIEMEDAPQNGGASSSPLGMYQFTANGLELYNPDTESWTTLTPKGDYNQIEMDDV